MTLTKFVLPNDQNKYQFLENDESILLIFQIITIIIIVIYNLLFH